MMRPSNLRSQCSRRERLRLGSLNPTPIVPLVHCAMGGDGAAEFHPGHLSHGQARCVGMELDNHRTTMLQDRPLLCTMESRATISLQARTS